MSKSVHNFACDATLAHAASVTASHGTLMPPDGIVVSAPTRASGSDLLTRREVAEWLGVSTRWVERHVAPYAQKRRRGRAWYTRADVERQLAAFAVKESAPAVAAPKRREQRPAMSGRMARAVAIGDALRRKSERR